MSSTEARRDLGGPTSHDPHELYRVPNSRASPWRCGVTAAGVFFHRTRAGETHISFKFDQVLVDLVKATVPAYARRYDGTNKAWIIAVGCDIYARVVADKVRALGYGVHETSDAAVAVTAPSRSWAENLMLAMGDPERKRSAYRALSKILHPDAGGDAGLFDALTCAYDKAGA